MPEQPKWADNLGNSGQHKRMQQCTNDEKQLCYLPWNHLYFLLLLTPCILTQVLKQSTSQLRNFVSFFPVSKLKTHVRTTPAEGFPQQVQRPEFS